MREVQNSEVEAWEPPTEAERKARNRRNVAIALGITAFMAIVFLVTVLKLGSSVLERAF
jgi:hypothetical protein